EAFLRKRLGLEEEARERRMRLERRRPIERDLDPGRDLDRARARREIAQRDTPVLARGLRVDPGLHARLDAALLAHDEQPSRAVLDLVARRPAARRASADRTERPVGIAQVDEAAIHVLDAIAAPARQGDRPEPRPAGAGLGRERAEAAVAEQP